MVTALRHAGVDAAILTTNDHGPGLLADLPTGRWVDYRGVPVLAFPRWSPPIPALREFAICPAMTRWLASHIREYELLHVHALFSYPSTSAMVQARRARIPYVLRTIGQLSPWSLAQSPGRKRWMLRLVERDNLQGAAALHFTTALECEQTRVLVLSAPSLVLPLGVDLPPELLGCPNEAADPVPEAPIRFLFLSRLHPKKRLENLLAACALLGNRQPQARWQLAIAGRGEPAYERSLRQRTRELGIEPHCLWLGHLEGDAKWNALREADWFVLPSAAENFGIAVVEALAVGTPVIVSPQVAVADRVVAAAAGMVSDSDPARLVEALETALEGAPPGMRLAARRLAQEDFSWTSLAARLREAYQRILIPRARR
jgi:glycosyltransferase involved in cell wall biosynthesis